MYPNDASAPWSASDRGDHLLNRRGGADIDIEGIQRPGLPQRQPLLGVRLTYG
jgi:hypothetical protein